MTADVEAVTLRPATPDDAAAIAAIWYQGWSDGHLGNVPDELVAVRTPESFGTRAAQRVGDTVVATVGGAVAGFVMVVADEVEQVYVSRHHRGTGVAAALLAEAERLVGANGHERAWLAVVAGNRRARRFYERNGWADEGAFDYQAASATGPIPVPSHRYVKRVRAGGARPDSRIERARLLYERAVFGGDDGGLATAERDLDGVEADLALARGRILHARFLADRNRDPDELALFARAAQLYRALGDERGEAESLFWVGTYHQVVQQDNDAALPALERSYELATRVGDKLTQSYAVRHLGFADMAAGAMDAARERLEESVRLRREIGFSPGVAAGLVALAYLAAEAGRPDEAPALLVEAGAIAEASDAHGILRMVEQARTRLA